jgi:predicted metal-dependent hydrolase
VKLPERIELHAIGAEWPVSYAPGNGAGAVARVVGDTLLVRRPPKATDRDARQALRRWLSRLARSEFEPHLEELAAFHGLSVPERIRIGFPRTRWASCSSRGTVSVNARMLFLPPELVRHVLLHELVHLEHLNHSREFYQRLSTVDPEHRATRATLNSAHELVPAWVDRDAAGPRRGRSRHRFAMRLDGRA